MQLCLPWASDGFVLIARLIAELTELSFQLVNLFLLFLDRVDEDSSQLRIVNTFDLAVLVFESEKRFDRCYLFSNQADVWLVGRLPVEADWLQSTDEL